MSKQVLLDLSPTGVIIYPCFLESFGFGEHHSGLVVFMLELDIHDMELQEKLKRIQKINLYTEGEEALKAYNSTGVATVSDSKALAVIEKKQRLSVLIPYLHQTQKNHINDVFSSPDIENQRVYAHLTTTQIIELLELKPEKPCVQRDIETLRAHFIHLMTPDVRRFFLDDIMGDAKILGVPMRDGTLTLSSCFGRFLMHSDGKCEHESAIDDVDMSKLYYHREEPGIHTDSELFNRDLFQVVTRTVSAATNHDNPKRLLENLFVILEEKPREEKTPLAKELEDSDVIDVSGYLIYNLKKQQEGLQPKHTPTFYKTTSQLLYICLSQVFFNKNKHEINLNRRISITNALDMYGKAKEQTLSLIQSIREDLPRLLKLSKTEYHQNEFYEPQSIQAVIGLPLAILMMGILQSTTKYEYVVGTEANPMLILTTAMSMENKGVVFSISNRSNRSSASLIELANNPMINILSRHTGDVLSFGDDIELNKSVFVSSLDRKDAGEPCYLKFHQADKDREHPPFSIRDLSMSDAANAIIHKTGEQFKQVCAGVLITPYRNIDIDSDINKFLFWLSFYYQDVRVIRIGGNLLGLSQPAHMVAFFNPRGQGLDYADTLSRVNGVVGFGNVTSANTIDEIAKWVGLEAVYMLTKSIFHKQNTENAIVDTKTLTNQAQIEQQALLDEMKADKHTKTDEQASSNASDDDFDLDSLDEIEDSGNDNPFSEMNDDFDVEPGIVAKEPEVKIGEDINVIG